MTVHFTSLLPIAFKFISIFAIPWCDVIGNVINNWLIVMIYQKWFDNMMKINQKVYIVKNVFKCKFVYVRTTSFKR